MYAIVDIETTGGYAFRHRITEVGIVLHNGRSVEYTYSTLVNPKREIPAHITHLTGISQEMVDDAPSFEAVADEIERLLQNRIFIAHNVNFDYGFLKHEFQLLNRSFSYKRMCSIRYFRKVFPGQRSYSLGKIARAFQIENPARHRALGDALTTTKLLEKAFEQEDGTVIQQLIKQNSGELTLPYQLDKRKMTKLPEAAGIYLLKDKSGKPIYIGKAKNLKKRVTSHFTGPSGSRRKQAFYREVADVGYILTGNETCAAIFEDHYIRKNWPFYNRAQKQRATHVGVFAYEDRVGAQRLAVVDKVKHQKPIKLFYNAYNARNWVFDQCEQFGLSKRLCGLPFDSEEEVSLKEHNKNLSAFLDDLRSVRTENYYATRGGRYPNELIILKIDSELGVNIGFVNEKLWENRENEMPKIEFEQLTLSASTVRRVEDLKKSSFTVWQRDLNVQV